jgi:hypothetical protein
MTKTFDLAKSSLSGIEGETLKPITYYVIRKGEPTENPRFSAKNPLNSEWSVEYKVWDKKGGNLLYSFDIMGVDSMTDEVLAAEISKRIKAQEIFDASRQESNKVPGTVLNEFSLKMLK